jgi:hypothetical protein
MPPVANLASPRVQTAVGTQPPPNQCYNSLSGTFGLQQRWSGWALRRVRANQDRCSNHVKPGQAAGGCLATAGREGDPAAVGSHIPFFGGLPAESAEIEGVLRVLTVEVEVSPV